MTVETKTCSKCGKVRPITDFQINKRSRSGRRTECGPCLAAKKKEEMTSPLVKVMVPCYAGCTSTIQVEIEPGTKPPRKICSYCQEWGSPDWLFSRRPKKEEGHVHTEN